jgi:ribonuclease HI
MIAMGWHWTTTEGRLIPISKNLNLAPSGVAIMLKQTAPHFLLLTQTQSSPAPEIRGGMWRFVLEQFGSSNRIEVSEVEPGIWGERLQLLAVVRGLEALEQPSRVTLVTPSRFVGNGIRRGLSSWREKGWQWERFGEMAPIKHCNLWKRIDQALQYHQVNCRIWDFDESKFRNSSPPTRNRISLGEIQNARKSSFAASGTQSIPPADPVYRSGSDSSHLPVASKRLEPIDFQKREFVGAALETISRSQDFLADKVKPVGRGRAFGYMPN